MYTTPEEDDAKAWAKKGLGNGPERVISVPKPTGKIFPADGLIPPEDLLKLEPLLGHNRYTQSKEPVPGTIVYMSLERKLGGKAQVNAALKSIGYQGLSYAINRGKDMQHFLIF